MRSGARYTVCEFCRKRLVDGVCYDDCCVDGNRFEPKANGKSMNDERQCGSVREKEFRASFYVMFNGLFYKPTVMFHDSKVVLICDVSPENAIFFDDKEV